MSAQVLLLGSPRVNTAGGHEGLPVTKLAALLVYLACAGRWVSREELLGVLRAEDDDLATRGSLRLLLTRARRLPWIERAALEAEPQRLRWRVSTDVQLLRADLVAGNWPGAVQRYQAPLLHGWSPAGLPGLHDWLEVERAALHSEWLGALSHYEAALQSGGAADELARVLGRALLLDPLSEPLLQRYLRAAGEAGRRQEGLAAFNAFQFRLNAEMALAPLPETLELARALRRVHPASPASSAQPQSTQAAVDVLRPASLVGRAQALQAARQADTALVLIAGEAGMGKSRLLQELLPGALRVRCLEELRHVPYLPLFEAVRGLQSGLPHLGGLPDLGSAAAELARFIPELRPSGTNVEPPQSPEPDDAGRRAARTGSEQAGASTGESGGEDQGRERLHEALARAFAGQRALILEDLHWADPATLDWLVFMVRRPQVLATPTRLYGAYRHNEVGEVLAAALQTLRADTTTVSLTPLDETEVGALISAATGQPGDGAEPGEYSELARWLHPRSGGNPLLALEWIRTLVQVGALRQQRGRWQAQVLALTRLGDLPMSPGLSDMVLRRAETLSAAERRVLSLASVLGGPLKVVHLARVLGENEWQVSDALARADRLGLLSGQHFAHDLIRQAVLQAIPEAQRRFMHARIAATLEGTLDSLVVAEHAFHGGEQEQAARLWFKVACEAFGTQPGFEREAEGLYQRIIDLKAPIPETDRARSRLAVRCRVHGRAEQAWALIEEVLTHSDDLEARAFALAEKATLAYFDGHLNQASEAIEQASKLARSVDDPALQRSIKLIYVATMHRRGEYEQALSVGQEMLRELRAERLTNRITNWMTTVGAILCDMGRFEEALALYREQLGFARRLNMKEEILRAAADIASTLDDLGRVQEGLALAEEALALGEFNDSFPLRYTLAKAYMQQGRLDEARNLLTFNVEHAPSLNTRAHAYALLAEVHLLCGQNTEAQQALHGGLSLAESSDLTAARAVMATAALKFGEPDVVRRAEPMAAALSEASLPAYLRADFQAALRVQAAQPFKA